MCLTISKIKNIEDMRKGKYRYVAIGTVTASDGNEYEFEIPYPYLHDTEKEAIEDERLVIQCTIEKNTETAPVLVLRRNEIPIHEMDEKEFHKTGGSIKVLKKESIGKSFLTNDDFVETNKSFSDMFPANIKKNAISTDTYYIRKELIANTSKEPTVFDKQPESEIDAFVKECLKENKYIGYCTGDYTDENLIKSAIDCLVESGIGLNNLSYFGTRYYKKYDAFFTAFDDKFNPTKQYTVRTKKDNNGYYSKMSN